MSELSHGDPQKVTCPKAAMRRRQLVSRNINVSRFPGIGSTHGRSFHRFTCTDRGTRYHIDVPLHHCDDARDEGS